VATHAENLIFKEEKAMKKLVLIAALAVLLAAIPSTVFGQTANWDGQVHKGDFSAFGGLGLGYGITIIPGVEYVWGDWKLGDVFPLAAGVAVKGAVNFYSDYWSSYGVAGLVTGHVGLKGLTDLPEFLQKFDFYAGIGLGFYYYSWASGYVTSNDDFGLVFANMEGTAFYINEKLAVYGEFNYWGYSRGVLGVLYRF
jgi:hypothetical protein